MVFVLVWPVGVLTGTVIFMRFMTFVFMMWLVGWCAGVLVDWGFWLFWCFWGINWFVVKDPQPLFICSRSADVVVTVVADAVTVKVGLVLVGDGGAVVDAGGD